MLNAHVSMLNECAIVNANNVLDRYFIDISLKIDNCELIIEASGASC